MKPSISKAILLSALVIPGAGQLYLKRFRTGIVLLTVTLVCFFYILAVAMNAATSALQQIQLQGDMVDMSQITKITSDSVQHATTGGYSLSISLIVICWLYGIVDAYLAASKARREHR